MANQKQGKGGGARKYGRKKAQPQQARYRDRALKKRRLIARLSREENYRAPGWELKPGYGLVETPETRTKSR